MPEINVDALRVVAEGATLGEWRAKKFGDDTCGRMWAIDTGADEEVVAVDFDRDYGAACGGVVEAHDAAHISAFDPPTVLALLDRLQAAEGAVERVRALAERWQRESDERRDQDRGDPVTLMLIAEGVAGMLARAIDGSDR